MAGGIERPLRSALYLPANRASAVAKARTSPCDAVILDLEDAVAPDAKAEALAAAVEAVRAGGFGERLVVVRVNDPEGRDEARAVAEAGAGAVLLPKIERAEQIAAARATVGDRIAIWAMAETCRLFISTQRIVDEAKPHGLAALIVGTNDLALEMRCSLGRDRQAVLPLLTQAVCAARAADIAILDGVFNDLTDEDGLASEAATGRSLGFDGKTAIHPNQLNAINKAFSPSDAEIHDARAIVEAFEAPGNAGAGVLRVGGRMAERLHLRLARRTLALAAAGPPA